MNKLIKEQLNKCNIEFPSYNDDTIQIFIPKGSCKEKKDIELDISEGLCYTIEVENYIIKPYDGFTLHQNWNKGIIPTDKQMNCEILQIMGKMIKINAVGVNDGKEWQGWIPRKSIKNIERV